MASGVRAEGVPVKVGEQTVGHAWVHADGIIEMSTFAYGKELLEHIQAGLVVGLNISPVVEPAIDARLVSRIGDKAMPRNNRPIPLMVNGSRIGTITVYTDGNIELSIPAGNGRHGKIPLDTAQKVLEGSIDSFSIDPVE